MGVLAGSLALRVSKAAVILGFRWGRLCFQDDTGGCWEDAGPRGLLHWGPRSLLAVGQLMVVGQAFLGSLPCSLLYMTAHNVSAGFIRASK